MKTVPPAGPSSWEDAVDVMQALGLLKRAVREHQDRPLDTVGAELAQLLMERLAFAMSGDLHHVEVFARPSREARALFRTSFEFSQSKPSKPIFLARLAMIHQSGLASPGAS